MNFGIFTYFTNEEGKWFCFNCAKALDQEFQIETEVYDSHYYGTGPCCTWCGMLFKISTLHIGNKKIVYTEEEYKKLDKNDRIRHTDSYVVYYTKKEGVMNKRYFTDNKRSHEDVEKYHRQLYPDAKITEIVYE